MHSVFSNGGELSPEQLAARSRATGLDFIATTEHNTADAHGEWGQLAGDDLLVILGQEVTTQTGHWLAIGIPPGQVVDWRYGLQDEAIGRHMEDVHRAGGLCVAAHPHAPYPSGTFLYMYEGFDAVEVWNGAWSSDVPWQADNEAALAEWGHGLGADIARGRWRPAMGNSDTHLEGQIGTPHTVVLAEGLNTTAILAGVRTGQSWIADSVEVELSLTASAGGRSVGIGEELHTRGEPVVARVDVRGVPSGIISFHSGPGEVHHAALPSSGGGGAEWRSNAAESEFVRVEVRHREGRMAAVTNPILLF